MVEGKVGKTRFHKPGTWNELKSLSSVTYVCGHCGDKVASEKGYTNDWGHFVITICPACNLPTIMGVNEQSERIRMPTNAPGHSVPNLPDDLNRLYEEARRSSGAGAYTASVMASRKMLMNLAVKEGAEKNKSFRWYVDYMVDNGLVPRNGQVWVDYIRSKGNEATHEIDLMTEDDSTVLLACVEMLLRFIYEFPSLVPSVTSNSEG